MQLFAAVAIVFFTAVQSVFVGLTSDHPTEPVQLQASIGNFLETKFSDVVHDLVETAADTEMGSDTRTFMYDKVAVLKESEGTPPGDASDGPATLAEYCAGKPTNREMHEKMEVDQKVMANWRGYGTFYPGKVEKKHSNGTVDIFYDDGFHEKRVSPGDVKEVKEKKKEVVEEKTKPIDDPACEMLKYVTKLKEKFGHLSAKLSQWLQAQRAKVAQGEHPEPPPSNWAAEPAELAAPAPAPAPAIAVSPADNKGLNPPVGVAPPKGKSEELETLKEQLADRDEQLKKLRREAQENEDALDEHREEAPPSQAPGAAKTVDDLIREYKERVAQRDQAIEQLKFKIAQQEQELARLGAAQVSLDEINRDVHDLSEEADKVETKRTDLEKRGKLDDELRVIVDRIVASVAKMEGKVEHLIKLQEEAKLRKAEADRVHAEAVKQAEARAVEKAEKEGKDPEEVSREVEAAIKVANIHHERERKEADLETLEAAQEVESEVKEAEASTTELDTGLHPHGEKWWRYRYEHSYIEAVIMIFIVFLYLIWNYLVKQLKNQIHLWSLPAGVAPKTEAEEIADETHGAMYICWLHAFSVQMLVCILVFLTVWTLAQTPLIHIIPQILRPSEDLRVPNHGEEYRRLALDICTIFFFAIMFYYCLMLSVAHETREMTMCLQEFEGQQMTTARSDVMRPHRSSAIATSSDQWEHCKTHFVKHMSHEMQTTSSKDYIEIQRLLGPDLSKFPLWHYLRLNVRMSVVELFTLSWQFWLPVVACFVIFMLCHRFAHMGYVRIMSFFGVCLLGIILSMAWKVKTATNCIHHGMETPRGTEKTVHQTMNTELVYLGGLQFALFFICYGVARTICQSWMWELHFWPVLCLLVLAIMTSVLFVLLVAPAIPSFCAVMAMPPYVDPQNVMIMLHVAKEVSDGRHSVFSTPRKQPILGRIDTT